MEIIQAFCLSFSANIQQFILLCFSLWFDGFLTISVHVLFFKHLSLSFDLPDCFLKSSVWTKYAISTSFLPDIFHSAHAIFDSSGGHLNSSNKRLVYITSTFIINDIYAPISQQRFRHLFMSAMIAAWVSRLTLWDSKIWISKIIL